MFVDTDRLLYETVCRRQRTWYLSYMDGTSCVIPLRRFNTSVGEGNDCLGDSFILPRFLALTVIRSRLYSRKTH